MEIKIFIQQDANSIRREGKKRQAFELANLLNQNGFKTSYGTPYKGGRGTYTLIKSVHSWLKSIGMDSDAENVALAYTKPNGDYAYDDYA